MLRTVLFTALMILCGQTVFSQCALVCNNSANVSLSADGTATIYPPNLLQSSVNCSNNFTITVTDEDGNQYGPLLDASLMGQSLTATLLHPASGNSCDVQLSLTDNLPPAISCGDTLFLWCNQPSHPDSIGYPAVSDNTTDTADILLTFTDIFSELPCADSMSNIPVTAYLTRTWTATDASGNATSCVQLIYLKRATVDNVVFPKHRDGVQKPVLECSVDDPLNLNLTGRPTIGGFPLNNATSCDLVVSYNDQQVPQCGGARKVIRTWSVFDLCTEDFRVFAQIIKVVDTAPPAITCPANVSFTTFSSGCTAQVYLPLATADDACSGVTVTAAWQFGNGVGPFNAVPVGNYTVTYNAQDGCANTSTCQIVVTVKDEKKPTALCESQVQVMLQEDGTALIFAESFDNGSYDNCGIAQRQVKRAGEGFDEFSSFDCSDIGQPVAVTLRISDAGGLSSECASQAMVIDPVEPEILCPAAVTISCGQDYNDLALTGNPYATDNCTTPALNFTNNLNINSCGNGTVTRTWKATDASGNATSCQQVITITDNTPITINFPPDILTYECNPPTDTALTGVPVVIGKDCEQLQVTHTDYYFYTAQPACFKLIRNWAIINWCVYQPNDPQGAGFWAHTQVIEVRDSTAPVLTCPANMTVGINSAGCSMLAQVPLPNVDDCSSQVAITNNGLFAQTANGAATGTYPKGTHTITYTAADGCGNTSECTLQLTVTDAQAPNPVCNNGVTVTIQQSGYVTLTPAMINNGSFDNCSPAGSLILQVSPNTFDCQSLGSKPVTLTVTDQVGNSAFCQTTVVIQDNFLVCNNQSSIIIAGKLGRENGDPLAQKLVGLTGGVSNAVSTDLDGTYDFPGLPAGQDYTLMPSYNTKPLNGVTTYDLVLIRRHILNVELLNSPYKLIAADVNKSGAVTTLDLVEIQKLILNITISFPNNNKSWRFVPASYVFPNAAQPFSPAFPETIEIENIEASHFNQDFVGIKVGDVNNSANPAQFGGEENEDRNFDENLTLQTQDIELVAGEEYAIPFVATSETDIAGFQFTLDFDAASLALRRVSPIVGSLQYGTPEAGALTVSWLNDGAAALTPEQALFEVRFTALRPTKLSEVLTINSLYTPAEAYAGKFSAATAAGFREMGVVLEYEKATAAMPEFFQNTPNPFQCTTSLNFSLPEAARVTFRLYDATGKLLRVFENDFLPGKNRFQLDLAELPASSLLLCEMNAGGGWRKTIRMMTD